MSVLKSFELTGKKALVTGASRGLGQAIAWALAEAGCNVAVNARTEEGLAETLAGIQKRGRKGAAVPADVSDEAAVQAMVESAHKQLGGLDILVNNAGVWGGSYSVRIRKADWDRVIQTNLTGVFLVAKAAAKLMMKQRSGKIINLSSVLGFRGSPQSAAYGAAKAGVIQLTRVLAIEMGPVGVQVNAIAPGFFDTDMTRAYTKDKQAAMEEYLSKIPAKRYGRPEELGGLVVFLASPAADLITGQTVVIDGGGTLV